MKKTLAILLAAFMLLSLVACGENEQTSSGNDGISESRQQTEPVISEQDKTSDSSCQEKTPPDEPDTSETNSDKVIFDGYEMDEVFTIYINGSEEWTPFPGKTDVFFGTDDEDIISLSDNGTTVQFTGKQVGETILGAVVGEEEKLALVQVRAMGGDITYKYNPPTDNYYIAFENNDGDSDVMSEVVAHIGRQHMYSYDTSYSFHLVDFENQKAYDREPNGDWMSDPEGNGLDMEEDWSGAPLPLSAMEEYFMDTLYALGGDASRLTEYYVGTETLYPAPYENTGIKCWVFDTAGFNGNNLKFWIDPSNGCCLKYEDTEDGDCTVVTEYNLNYTSWDDTPQ